MISFREIADQCDAYDQEVADITEARKDFWSDVRDQLPARDVRALKAAIKARKRRRADLDGEEDHDQRTAEILLEIERGTDVALTRGARADLPPHDEDGVIIEPSGPICDGSAVATPEVGAGTSEVQAQLANVRHAPAPDLSHNDVQREATVKTTSPAPVATRPASSQEPCSHGSGAVQDRCESTASPITGPVDEWADLDIPTQFIRRPAA
jgi:uncharacterized protein (UPF0335 family)